MLKNMNDKCGEGFLFFYFIQIKLKYTQKLIGGDGLIYIYFWGGNICLETQEFFENKKQGSPNILII